MQDITMPQGESILKDLDALEPPPPASRVQDKLERRLEEARAAFRRLYQMREDHPGIWDAEHVVRLERADAYVKGLELAKMIVLEEGL
jgi:hypothetical protein